MFFLARHGVGRWKLISIQPSLLAALLVATFAFHISGTTLVELRIARLVVFIGLVVGIGWFSRRRGAACRRPRRRALAELAARRPGLTSAPTPVGWRRHGRRDRVGHVSLPARRSSSPSTRSTRSASTSAGPRARSARAISTTTTPTTTGSGPKPSCRPRRSRRSATSSRSTSRCSTPAMRSSRSTSPAGMSGTVSAAEQARERLGDRAARVFVFDSATACGGEGLVIMAAAAAVRAGAGGAEVYERARAARAGLKMWFAIDTLEYLRRGGRIAGAQAWLGSALRIKPILTVESEITPVERVRTSRRAFERMVDLLRSVPRGRRRRLDGPAHPGAGRGREARRTRDRDLRRASRA